MSTPRLPPQAQMVEERAVAADAVEAPVEPEPPPTDEERALQIDNAFEAEVRDASWAPSTQATVEQGLRERAGTSAIRGTECRSILCRTEIVHRDQEGQRQFEQEMTDLGRRFWLGEMFFQPIEEDARGMKSVIYLVRPGAVAPVE